MMSLPNAKTHFLHANHISKGQCVS